MGYRPYVQTKRVIKYADAPTPNFNWKNELVYDFLVENGVDVLTNGDDSASPDWEMDKDELRSIPDSAFTKFKTRDGVTGNDLRQLVNELIAAKTGDYSYLSWW